MAAGGGKRETSKMEMARRRRPPLAIGMYARLPAPDTRH